MPELSHIDPRSAALLVMDYQVDTLTKFMTAAQSADAIACVPDLIAMAREGEPIVVKPASARSLAPTWRRCCAPTARHAGARRRPAWQVFMNERAPACLHQAMTFTQRHRVGDVLNNGLP
jgi:hypothetical protein